MIRRREFITLLGGAAAAWPVAASAQQPAGKLPIIGYIGGGGRTSQQAWLDAFMQRLRERGWIEGRTVTIEVRWGEGRPERYAEIAAEFVRLLSMSFSLAGPRQRSRQNGLHQPSRSSSPRRATPSAAS